MRHSLEYEKIQGFTKILIIWRIFVCIEFQGWQTEGISGWSYDITQESYGWQWTTTKWPEKGQQSSQGMSQLYNICKKFIQINLY